MTASAALLFSDAGLLQELFIELVLLVLRICSEAGLCLT
jgi:hypothetical protein